jgi:hypothetical protein
MASAQTSEKDFLAELEEIARAARSEIEARQIGLDPSPAARAERRRRVLKDGDFEFFAYTYLAHHIRPPASNFHRHFFQRFPQLLDKPSGAKEWWIAPRGEAKSSLTTKVGPVWCAVRALLQKESIRREVGWDGPLPYFIDYITMLGAETKLPTKLLEVVKVELSFNAALGLDFPEVCGPTKNWKIGEFTTKTGVKMEAFGAEQAQEPDRARQPVGLAGKGGGLPRPAGRHGEVRRRRHHPEQGRPDQPGQEGHRPPGASLPRHRAPA